MSKLRLEFRFYQNHGINFPWFEVSIFHISRNTSPSTSVPNAHQWHTRVWQFNTQHAYHKLQTMANSFTNIVNTNAKQTKSDVCSIYSRPKLGFQDFQIHIKQLFFLKLFFHINQLSFNLFFKQTLFTLCEMSIIFNNIYYFFIQTQQTYIIIKHEIPYSSTFIWHSFNTSNNISTTDTKNHRKLHRPMIERKV